MVEKQRQLEAHIKDLTNLIGVARTVVSTLELDLVLETILEKARQLMEMPAGTLAVYHESSEQMILHVHAGLSADFTRNDRWPLLGKGDPLTREAMADLGIRYLPDITATTGAVDEELTKEGIRAVVCIPLAALNRPVGVLYLYDRSPRQFNQRQLDLLAILASFAAMAIDNASLHSRTKLMALTDALTGLYNNRYFMQVFPHELIRARRYMKPLSLLMIDVDNFKKLNDTYGHPKGDQVLASVGSILSGSLRAADFSFRYGGEEFAVILPETRLEGAFMVGESLREKITKGVTPLLGRNADRVVSVSLGVAGYPIDGSTTDQLLDHADKCLYQAKRQGRDRVHWESSYVIPASQATPAIASR